MSLMNFINNKATKRIFVVGVLVVLVLLGNLNSKQAYGSNIPIIQVVVDENVTDSAGCPLPAGDYYVKFNCTDRMILLETELLSGVRKEGGADYSRNRRWI
jgi:hypothetical protein